MENSGAKNGMDSSSKQRRRRAIGMGGHRRKSKIAAQRLKEEKEFPENRGFPQIY